MSPMSKQGETAGTDFEETAAKRSTKRFKSLKSAALNIAPAIETPVHLGSVPEALGKKTVSHMKDEKLMLELMRSAPEPESPMPPNPGEQIRGASKLKPKYNQTAAGGDLVVSHIQCDIEDCDRPGRHCRAKYCDCMNLGCNKVRCETHKSQKFFLETKRGKPTVCTDCEGKVQAVSYSLCIGIPTVVLILLISTFLLIQS